MSSEENDVEMEDDEVHQLDTANESDEPQELELEEESLTSSVLIDPELQDAMEICEDTETIEQPSVEPDTTTVDQTENLTIIEPPIVEDYKLPVAESQNARDEETQPAQSDSPR